MEDKVLVAGGDGLLGGEFPAGDSLKNERGFQFYKFGHQGLDISDPEAVRRSIREINPKYVINCAAFRDIDRAETERDAAYSVNVVGSQNLAEYCAESGAKLIHYSTHGVFDGEKRGPYLESDSPGPLNFYGASKLEGEKKIASILPADQYLILRISWPYGRKNNNFISAILSLAKKNGRVRVVSDHFGVPNPASLLASKTLDLIREASGLFHLSCLGTCSRYQFISHLFERMKLPFPVVPVPASEFPTLAKRPKNIAIATEMSEIGNLAPMPNWEQALDLYLVDNRVLR